MIHKDKSLICGEAIIDLIPQIDDGVNICYYPQPGGSPYNVAIGMARLEAHVAWLGRLSDDGNGKLMDAKLKKSKVDTRFTQYGSEPQAMACVYYPDNDITDPHYSFYFAGTTEQALANQHIPQQLFTDLTHIHFGSIAAITPPNSQIFTDIRQNHTKRCLISYDPNIRPSIMGQADIVRPKVENIIRDCHLLKASSADCQWLYPDQPLKEIINHYHCLGPRAVIITDGHNGCWLGLSGHTPVHVRAPSNIKVVDSVGAGDSFMAGVLAFLYHQSILNINAYDSWSMTMLANALRYANKAAAITVTRHGADLPWAYELL